MTHCFQSYGRKNKIVHTLSMLYVRATLCAGGMEKNVRKNFLESGKRK